MQEDIKNLRKTIQIAAESRANGNHPFGSVLVGPDGSVLIECGNTYTTDKGLGHAEFNVAREATQRYESDFLKKCTLVTSVEPCCMCSGAIYWADIGSVVYGLTEKKLAELTGNNPENLTLDLSCHQVFQVGQRSVEVRGPYSEVAEEVAAGHKDFW